MACLVSVSEFSWLSMCTLLVKETVGYLVSEGELAWFLMCMLLVTETVTHLIVDSKLAWDFVVVSIGNIHSGASLSACKLLCFLL